MTAGLTAWLTQYGYVGLALGVFLESAGLPVPGETALLVAALAAAHGSLSLPLVMITAASAGILGDNLGFAVGRRFGRPWLERFGPHFLLSPARLARADAFFARWGGPAIALARFAPGVRVVLASKKCQTADQEMFRHLGVEPKAQRLIALKSSVHFRADFQPIAKEVLVVRAPGPALADPADFLWTRLRHGMRLGPLGPVFAGQASRAS